MKNQLAENSFGRMLLHLLCLMQNGNFRWHWAGIRRELQLHPVSYVALKARPNQAPGHAGQRLTVLALFCAATMNVLAGPHTWSGAINSSWSNPGNWSSGGAPQLGETNLTLMFPVSPTLSKATNDVGNLLINSINIQGNDYTIGGDGITMIYNGVGLSILCSGTNHQIALPITLNAAGLGFTVGTTASLTLRGTLNGPGSFTKYGYGKLTLAGALDNTYAGVTKVLGGELDLNQGGAGSAVAIPGDLIVGTVGNQNTIYVYYLRDHQVADTATVTVNLSSYLGLYGHADAIGHLVLDGGYILTDRINPIVSGKLTLLGDVSVLAGSQATSTIVGHVSLGGATRTFDVTNGVYLFITGDVSDGAGTGGLTKAGGGTLTFNSSLPNTYSGTTTVSSGLLVLNNSSAVAVPGALVIGDDVNPSGTSIVQAIGSNQVAAAAPVTIHSSGVLDLSVVPSASQNVGPLNGNGLVQLGVSSLTTSNQAYAQFDGRFLGTGSLIKQGTGKWMLNGVNDQFTGNTIVNGGTLHVQNWIPSSPIAINPGGNLMGNGIVGNVSSTGGTIRPGCCPGMMKLDSKNLSLDAASTFPVELNGVDPGGFYSQLSVVGTVNLGGATLQAALGFASATSNQFTIIQNDGADAVSGTFKNLPEGATLVIGSAQFQISYQSGDGNDVVLTQVSAIIPSQISSITKLPDGSIQLAGTGLANATYTVQTTESLTAPVQWSDLGTATADVNGAISFIVPAAPNIPKRFFRFALE